MTRMSGMTRIMTRYVYYTKHMYKVLVGSFLKVTARKNKTASKKKKSPK